MISCGYHTLRQNTYWQRSTENSPGIRQNLVRTVTGLLRSEAALPTTVAPDSRAPFNANSRLRFILRLIGRDRGHGTCTTLVAVDGGTVTLEIVLAGERPAAGSERADVGLGTIGVVRVHMSLEIVSTSKS